MLGARIMYGMPAAPRSSLRRGELDASTSILGTVHSNTDFAAWKLGFEYTVPNIMRVGVLGRGFMGQTHLKALGDIPDVEVAADREIAKVIADPRVDAGDLCLPTNLHAPA